jgi:hypothetical protein
MCFEYFGEILRAGKSAIQGDFCNGFVQFGRQFRNRFFQTNTLDKIIERLTNHGAKYSMKMKFGKAGNLGKFRQIQILIIMIVDIIDCTIQTGSIFILQ